MWSLSSEQLEPLDCRVVGGVRGVVKVVVSSGDGGGPDEAGDAQVRSGSAGRCRG